MVGWSGPCLKLGPAAPQCMISSTWCGRGENAEASKPPCLIFPSCIEGQGSRARASSLFVPRDTEGPLCLPSNSPWCPQATLHRVLTWHLELRIMCSYRRGRRKPHKPHPRAGNGEKEGSILAQLSENVPRSLGLVVGSHHDLVLGSSPEDLCVPPGV